MSHRLRGIAGTAAIVAGALFILAEVAFFMSFVGAGDAEFAEIAGSPMFLSGAVMLLVGLGLAIPGVMGIYRHHAEQAGTFGLVAAGVTCAGLVLAAGAMWAQVFAAPWIADQAPQLLADDAAGGSLELGFMISFIGLSVATAIFGISTLMSGVYPRWIGVTAIVAGVVGALPFVPAGQGVLFGLVTGGYGMSLRRAVHELEDAEATTAMAAPPAAPA